jgi:hypothetical protein
MHALGEAVRFFVGQAVPAERASAPGRHSLPYEKPDSLTEFSVPSVLAEALELPLPPSFDLSLSAAIPTIKGATVRNLNPP